MICSSIASILIFTAAFQSFASGELKASGIFMGSSFAIMVIALPITVVPVSYVVVENVCLNGCFLSVVTSTDDKVSVLI